MNLLFGVFGPESRIFQQNNSVYSAEDLWSGEHGFVVNVNKGPFSCPAQVNGSGLKLKSNTICRRHPASVYWI